ncbi:MAG TPA: alpha-L-fucosidase [Chthonomonadales bacterium]|nr:alpha-L-fucosidase [Chthonomonadales bacterium]
MTLQPEPTAGDTSWFVRDRFGLFIHWGLYALPARHEWVKQHERIPDDAYDVYFRHFDPDLYDPAAWAKAAATAGMKYFVVTTKHHEGFCLWDTDLTDYKAPKTPAGRDLLRPMVEAFREQDLRVGFYHSLIDWHHPHFVVDDLHSMRNHPDRATMNQTRDQPQYAAYLHGQVRELLTRFGRIDVLWCDFSYPNPEPGRGKGRDEWQSEKLYAMIRDLQPHVVLNDRLDLPAGWDIKTPEQFQPRGWVMVDGKPVVWEACQTFSGSWGYHRDEASWKSVEQLVQMLIDTVSKGGNLLLNVGPTGRGEFDQRALDRLSGMGEWMKRHSRSIYGCTQAPQEFVAPRDCRLTYSPEKNRLYVHVFAWPFVQLHMEGIRGRVAYAQLLNDASEVRMTDLPSHQASMEGKPADIVTFTLPVQKPPVTVPVIELFLK